jgi:hypothetical protein
LAQVAPDIIKIATLKADSFADGRDYFAVRRAMGLDGSSLAEYCPGPFSGFGTFARISGWVEEQLRPLGLRLNGDMKQLQADSSFALIRFATSGRAVWFKAVGDPNLSEFPITRLLAERLPRYVPELVAVKTEWNAWLTTEARGQGLFDSSDLATWCRAAGFLAEMQIASLPYTADFLAAGAHDVRSQSLRKVIGRFFCVMEEAMQEQSSTTVRRLNKQEIGTVREQISAALDELEEAGIPNALNHLDLNSCNVVVSPSACTFLDWAEAAVGNPFFSLEYLRQQFRQVFPGRMEAEQDFCASYMNRWKRILGGKTATDLVHLAPLTATFAFATTALPWDERNLNRREELAAFLRSLVRRMHRESEQIKNSRAA